MAKRKKIKIYKIDVTGHIFYKWRGADVSRLKGNTGNQAPVAKKQAAILGKASALSARLRASFEPILPPPINRKILNRFNNAIQQWLRLGQIVETGPIDNIPFISGFNFYGAENVAGYLSHFSVDRTVGGAPTLTITELDPSEYPRILSSKGNAHLQIIVASLNVKNPAAIESSELKTDISFTTDQFPAQVLPLPLQTSPGYMMVVAFSTNGSNVSIAGAMYN